METGTRSLEAKSLNSPDETRPFAAKGKAEVVKLGGVTVGRGVFEPGSKWSEHVKPIAGTPSCQASHVGYVVSGRMRIKMDDGTEAEVARARPHRRSGPRRVDPRRRALRRAPLPRHGRVRQTTVADASVCEHRGNMARCRLGGSCSGAADQVRGPVQMSCQPRGGHGRSRRRDGGDLLVG